jgi:hypothetical protein
MCPRRPFFWRYPFGFAHAFSCYGKHSALSVTNFLDFASRYTAILEHLSHANVFETS